MNTTSTIKQAGNSMTQQDIDYLCDTVEDMMTRLIRTESKLSALMQHLNLNQYGEPIDPANRGQRSNTRANPSSSGKGRAQRGFRPQA